MRGLVFIMLLPMVTLGGSARAQNLIPNAGFEELDTPCIGGTSYSYLADWFPTNCSSGAGYFHPCGTANGSPEYGAPDNVWGGQEAFDGVAYAGTLTYFYLAQYPPHHYLSVPLLTPLVNGAEYCLSLHTSLAGRSTYRSMTLSAVLTSAYPSACDGNDTINWPDQAQVVFDLSTVDSTNWSALSGTFVARGGEQYLTIGNFTNFQYSDTVFFGTSPSPLKFAFYYIDGVELRTCEAVIQEERAGAFTVFPNPAKDAVRCELASAPDRQAEYEIMDGLGRVVSAGRLTNSSFDVAGMRNGAYSVVLRCSDGTRQARLLVQH